MVVDDPGQDSDVVVVQDDGLVGVAARVHDGAGDLERLGQEVQGVLGVLDDPVPQLPQALGEGGVLRRLWLDALVEGDLDGVQDLRRRRGRLDLVVRGGRLPRRPCRRRPLLYTALLRCRATC